MNQSTSHTKKRNVVLYLMLLVMTIICIGCKPDNGEASTMNPTTPAGSMAGKKVAIVYYSWSGHTKAVANKIHARTGGDMFLLTPADPYPTTHDPASERAGQERRDNARPVLKNIPDMKSYDVIFLGYPIWWYSHPMFIDTFVESQDLSGKIIIPFATSGGSDIRDSVAELQQLLPKSQFGKSLILQNPNNDKKIQDWLTENGW